jgi:hypothetical protein
MAKYKDGLHVPDTTPVEVPLDLQPETTDQKIARGVAIELSKAAQKAGVETLEESMDFDIPDEENDPITQYEIEEMQEEFPSYERMGEEMINAEKNEEKKTEEPKATTESDERESNKDR